MVRTSCGGGRQRDSGEEFQHVRLVWQEPLFGPEHEAVVLPGAQRGEPQIPIEARLIGRVDAGGLAEILRLVAERIGVQFFRRASLEIRFRSGRASLPRISRIGWRCEKGRGCVRATRRAGACRGKTSRRAGRLLCRRRCRDIPRLSVCERAWERSSIATAGRRWRVSQFGEDRPHSSR